MERDPEQDGRRSARVRRSTEQATRNRLENEPGRYAHRTLDRKDRDHLGHRSDRSDDQRREND
jgi:hypothetical protein